MKKHSYIIEKLKVEEYFKCSNIWDMDKFPYTEQFLKQITSGSRVVYIYKINDEFIGEGALVFENSEAGYTIPDKRIYLSRLIVKKEYRNQGIGQAILSFLLEKAADLGYCEATVGVDCNNDNAVHIYRKNGFKVFEKATDKHGEYYKMIKKLE